MRCNVVFFQYLSKKLGHMGQKTGFAPVKYWLNWTTKKIKWPQVSEITGYKTAISESLRSKDGEGFIILWKTVLANSWTI